MSQGAVDLSASPSPPSLVRPWQTSTSLGGAGQWPGLSPQQTAFPGSARYSPGDWCNSSGWRTAGRRSPPSMRRQSQRQRERQLRSQGNQQQQQQQQQQQPAASGGERRAFHPPGLQTHHATVLPPPPSHHLPFQPRIIIDLSSDAMVPTTAPISIPVSVPSYAVPMCTAHTLPATCSLHRGPYAPIPVTAGGGGGAGAGGGGGGRPTHAPPPPPPPAIPICSMGHIPMCGVHLPACGGHHHHHHHHLPVSQASLPHAVLPQESLMTHVHTHHHVPPQVQYFAAPPPTQTRSSEVEIIGERPAAFHVPSSTQHNPSLTPSPPLHLLQESILRNPPEVHHMHAYPRLNSISRQQQRRATVARPWRNQVSPSVPVQPSYPGWFLRYLFPNPPVNQMELENEDAEVENYEALLNLAERLGEAKPRGLTKAYIDQLPSYLYKPDTHRSINDQTCCVVCMCDFEARQLLRVLPCSHEFHARCVDKWLKTNRTCPICRADASEMNNQSE
ncbi:RING finger protein 44-like isoform X2 [Acanthaster planci]|nr:RING finger protein 44-like isoform X2 [Acanthaster planci]XP_022097686.1 RING finger protein 44-like isoform X2 [Acanthaster planci]